jgi:hypothetical protein
MDNIYIASVFANIFVFGGSPNEMDAKRQTVCEFLKNACVPGGPLWGVAVVDVPGDNLDLVAKLDSMLTITPEGATLGD